jgi:hypothetical protein
MAYAPAERTAFDVRLSDLGRGPQTVDLGILDRSITVECAPSPDGPRAAEFTFVDPSPRPGVNPYWLRVIQTDLEMAWTSPLFVDFVAPSR